MTNNYILDGKTPVLCKDISEWGRAYEDNRVVADDNRGEVRISTIFLGVDQNFGKGPLALFETMIFSSGNEYQERYETWEQAEEGHKRAVALVEAGYGYEGAGR